MREKNLFGSGELRVILDVLVASRAADQVRRLGLALVSPEPLSALSPPASKGGGGAGPSSTTHSGPLAAPSESAWAWIGDVAEWSQRLTDQSLVPSLTGHIAACVGVTAAADVHEQNFSDVDRLADLPAKNRPYSYGGEHDHYSLITITTASRCHPPSTSCEETHHL